MKTGPASLTRVHSVGTQVHTLRDQGRQCHLDPEQRPREAAVATVQCSGMGSNHTGTRAHAHMRPVQVGRRGHEPPPEEDVASTQGSRGLCTHALLLPPTPPVP